MERPLPHKTSLSPDTSMPESLEPVNPGQTGTSSAPGEHGTGAPPTHGGEERTRFSLTRSLGKGGTGEVHDGILHEADGVDRRIAIKVLQDNPDDEPGRLRTLVGQWKGLSHPHVVLPFDFVASSAGRVLLYPFHPGQSLVEALRRLKRLGKPLPPALAVEMLAQVLEGLQFLHSLTPPQLHLGLKPSNLHVGSDGMVRILDVGLPNPQATSSNRSRGLAVINLLPYLAPEQLGDTYRPAPQADLYALGAIGYELLAGRPLFDGSSARRELEIRVGFGVQDKVRALESVFEGIAPVLGRALALAPKDRYASAQEMREALEPLRAGADPEVLRASLAVLMVELEALPDRKPGTGNPFDATTLQSQPVPVKALEAAVKNAATLTGSTAPANGKGTVTSKAPPRVVEAVPAHVLANMKGGAEAGARGGTNPLRMGILVGSLVLAIAALWYVDQGRHQEQPTPADQALKPSPAVKSADTPDDKEPSTKH